MAKSALGIETGTIFNYLKWVAETPGHWEWVEYIKPEGEEKFRSVKFTSSTLTFTVDFENIEKLYVRFPVGGGPPLRVYARRPGKDLPPTPTSHDPENSPYQIAGQVLVQIHDVLKRPAAHEILATSAVMRNALCLVYDEWLLHKDKHPGELPVIQNIGSKNDGSNSQPILKIVGWNGRSDLLLNAVISELRDDCYGSNNEGNGSGEPEPPQNENEDAPLSDEEMSQLDNFIGR
jgi:hypothetical protein